MIVVLLECRDDPPGSARLRRERPAMICYPVRHDHGSTKRDSRQPRLTSRENRRACVRGLCSRRTPTAPTLPVPCTARSTHRCPRRGDSRMVMCPPACGSAKTVDLRRGDHTGRNRGAAVPGGCAAPAMSAAAAANAHGSHVVQARCVQPDRPAEVPFITPFSGIPQRPSSRPGLS
jgi:hypothetical protein